MENFSLLMERKNLFGRAVLKQDRQRFIGRYRMLNVSGKK